jgi:acyl-CoA synthetase (NDP forming)
MPVDEKTFESIKERFKNADVDEKIEIYTTVQGLSVEQYKELLRMFPIKYFDKLERAMSQ